MVKLLIVVAAVALLLWLWFGRRAPDRRSSRGPAPPPVAQDMLACAHCGVHLPRSEALIAAGRPYCSAAHRDAGSQP